MLQFIKNLFKSEEEKKMELLLHSLVFKACMQGKKELITSKSGVTQIIYEVRIHESFIEECMPFANRAARSKK